MGADGRCLNGGEVTRRTVRRYDYFFVADHPGAILRQYCFPHLGSPKHLRKSDQKSPGQLECSAVGVDRGE